MINGHWSGQVGENILFKNRLKTTTRRFGQSWVRVLRILIIIIEYCAVCMQVSTALMRKVAHHILGSGYIILLLLFTWTMLYSAFILYTYTIIIIICYNEVHFILSLSFYYIIIYYDEYVSRLWAPCPTTTASAIHRRTKQYRTPIIRIPNVAVDVVFGFFFQPR